MGLKAPVENRRYTISEYLDYERAATQRHEYRDGKIVAMAGGTYRHSLIVANTIRALGNRLEGKPCRVFEGNLRVRIPRTPIYVYPDVSVICGEPRFDSDDKSGESVTNPRLIIEVLSPSTEAYDRGEKLRRYIQLESLEEYVLISQDSACVETFYRQNDSTWSLALVNDLDARAKLRSLGLELSLAEVYAGVTFNAAGEAPEKEAEK